MAVNEEEEERRLRAVALKNANAIHLARQRAERDLAAERERLRITLASIGDAVICTDAEGRVTYLNGVAETLTGWIQAEAAGRPLPEVFHILNEYSRHPTENPALRALREGIVVGLANHTVLIARDGTERPIDDSAAPMRDEAGAPIGAVLVFRDVTDRRRADEALTRLASIVESSDDAILTKTLDGVIRSWNAGAERLFGYTPAEAVGKSITLIIPPERLEEERMILARLVRGERIEHFETIRVAKDGRRLDISLTVSPLRDAEGRIVGASKVARDFTDRKRAEEGLRASEARYRAIVEATPECVKLVAPDGTLLQMNSAGLAMIEGDESALGQCVYNVISPEHRDIYRAFNERVCRGEGGTLEFDIIGLKGTRRHMETTAVPLPAPDGGFTQLAVTRDVSTRKRAADAVRFLADASASIAELVDYESTLRRIANLAVAGFADWCVVDVIDETGVRRRLAVTGPESPAVAAARTADAEFRADQAGGGIPHVLRTGEAEVVPDLFAVDPATALQGAERIMRLCEWGVRSYMCVPLLSRGRILGGMTFLSASTHRRFGPDELRVARDLAERVTAAIENARLYRELQEQERRKDEFLATLAHELRNPLAPVRNGIQLLRAALPGDERVARALGMMERQVGHIVHLVDDLMDVARVSSGKVALRKERIDLRVVVDAAIETTRQAVEAGGHELSVDLPLDPLTFEADRTRLTQVFANLLNNAAKYTPNGGRIALSAVREDRFAVVRVTDTGLGIPAEMLPKIFDMFTQVGTSLERSQGGLGIGLTLVRRLVEMHGGTVMAESPGPGRGSTFVVRMPLAVGASEPHDPTKTERAAPPATGVCILVVDDNRDSAESLAMLLELKGHEVRMAHDGPEALRVLGTFRPRLILLDIGLPGMNGYEVARRIRESTELRGVTLAALTGWGQEEDRRRSREAGFDYHLTKPADPAQVEKILSELSSGR
jgi:PAS domain S-box-containing protein